VEVWVGGVPATVTYSGRSPYCSGSESVSAAYYAVFHLLISEAIATWSRATSRNSLGRMFDHSVMKKASVRISDPKRRPFAGEDPTVVRHLKTVAEAFVQLQDKRQIADYGNATVWTDGSSQRSEAGGRCLAA
jgi:hypothetical protein